MTRSFNRIAAAALIALAAGPFMAAQAATSNDADLASAVQSSLSNSLGSDASGLTVTANNGNITLHGWTQGPLRRQQGARRAQRLQRGAHLL